MCHEILYKEDVTEDGPAEPAQPIPPVQPPRQNRVNAANVIPDRRPDVNQNNGESSESENDDLNQRRRPRRRHPAGVGIDGVINNNYNRIYRQPNGNANDPEQLLVRRGIAEGTAGARRDEVDGNETDVEDNDSDYDNGDLHDIEGDGSDTDSFVELEDLEVWNRELDRDHEDRDRGDGGGIQAANGRGLVLFL